MTYLAPRDFFRFVVSPDIVLMKMEHGYIVRHSNINDYSKADYINEEALTAFKLAKLKVRIDDNTGKRIERVNY